MKSQQSLISIIKTEEEFKRFVENFYQDKKKPKSFGICRAELSHINSKQVLSVNFPVLNFEQNFGSFAVFAIAAKLQQFDNNEIIVDIDAAFVMRAFCLFYPFIVKELEFLQNNLTIFFFVRFKLFYNKRVINKMHALQMPHQYQQ